MVGSSRDSLVLSIAGIPVLIFSKNHEFLAQTKERYGNFIVSGLNPSLKIEVEITPRHNVRTFPPGERKHQITSDPIKRKYLIRWEGLTGEFDLTRREGAMSCSPDSDNEFNSFLRFVYSFILIKEPGFLLHACSLIRNGKGYVFPGKSGSGKTTIAQLSHDAVLLSDEISLVKWAKDTSSIFGTPFMGDLGTQGENTSAPIHGIYFPVKNKINKLCKLSPREGLKRLLPNVVFFAKHDAFSKKLFDLSAGVVMKTRSYELRFTPDHSLWSYIDAE